MILIIIFLIDKDIFSSSLILSRYAFFIFVLYLQIKTDKPLSKIYCFLSCTWLPLPVG